MAEAPPRPRAPPSESAARHTYDLGYRRWEKFDVDAALREVDRKGPARQQAVDLEEAAVGSASGLFAFGAFSRLSRERRSSRGRPRSGRHEGSSRAGPP